LVFNYFRILHITKSNNYNILAFHEVLLTNLVNHNLTQDWRLARNFNYLHPTPNFSRNILNRRMRTRFLVRAIWSSPRRSRGLDQTARSWNLASPVRIGGFEMTSHRNKSLLNGPIPH
jgi:hypothetical protein